MTAGMAEATRQIASHSHNRRPRRRIPQAACAADATQPARRIPISQGNGIKAITRLILAGRTGLASTHLARSRHNGERERMILLILPWVWTLAALLVAVYARRSKYPGHGSAFALVLGAMALGSFFFNPAAAVQWWLVAWQGGCFVLTIGIFLHLRLTRPKK